MRGNHLWEMGNSQVKMVDFSAGEIFCVVVDRSQYRQNLSYVMAIGIYFWEFLFALGNTVVVGGDWILALGTFICTDKHSFGFSSSHLFGPIGPVFISLARILVYTRLYYSVDLRLKKRDCAMQLSLAHRENYSIVWIYDSKNES